VTRTADIKKTSAAIGLIPNINVETTAEMPPRDSTIVYLADIFSPQYLHFPLRLIHEIIGIKSLVASS
jgi:hypothetical protein